MTATLICLAVLTLGSCGASGAGSPSSTTPSLAAVVRESSSTHKDSTTVWQTGNGSLGQYATPVVSDGQCAGVGPTISGNNATFVALRNSNASYTYGGKVFGGASTCYRNQLNPIDPNTGTNFLVAMGKPYTWTFQTVVTLNGNYVYGGASDGGLAVDIPAIVWQMHSYGGDGGACTSLTINNTYVAYVNGIKTYGTVPQGGAPIWNFHDCNNNQFGTGTYNSPDTLHDGQVDQWEIDMTPTVLGQSGGSIVVYRNGAQVYSTKGAACDASTTNCFWNFGPYMFFWATTEKPSGWNDAGVKVEVDDMTLKAR